MFGRAILFSLALLVTGVAFALSDNPAGNEVATGSSLPDAERVKVPPPTEQAMRYYRSGNFLWLANVALGLAVPLLVLLSGLSGRIRDAARRIGRYWYFTLVVYFVLYSVLMYLVEFPLGFYQSFIRQHAYGLSNQTLAKWASDSLLELVVALIAGTLFLWIPFLLLEKSPRRWWFYTSLLGAPFMFFVMLVQPVFIAPLFNDFGEMKDKRLESEILALADCAGIEGGRVYEVDKSVDTKAVNAYVTGFGNTKRIVLWDTIIEKLDEQELLFVMGHEMGHYVLRHIIVTILIASLVVFIVLYLIHRTAGWFIERHRDRIGFHELHDIAALPLIILLFNVYGLFATPAVLAISRYHEHEADRFGLEITRQNHAAATAFVKLQRENLGNPRPGWLYVLWCASHPPLGSRIDFCNEYRPREAGRPLTYERHFR